MIHKDIFSIVFRYLPLRDRVMCLTVCREWLANAAEFNEWTEKEFKDCVTRNLLYFVQHTNINPSVSNNFAIRWAADWGYIRIVKLLLLNPLVDPTADEHYTIRWASTNGETETVKLLLADPRINPAAMRNDPIKWAARNGHAEVVKLLLADPRVDPTVDNNYAFAWASRSEHTEVVELLKPYKK